MQRPFLRGARPLAFAHRGGSKLWPENTLEAFEGAVGLGFDYLETDAHLTCDGVVVLHHDARIDRTTDSTGSVDELTFGELSRADAGYRFTPDGRTFPYRNQGLRIPSFEEVIERFPNVNFNVEIKQGSPSMARALWALIERHRLHDRILVAAGDDALGREFDALSCGRVARSPGVRGVLRFWAAARAGLTRHLPISYDVLQVPARHLGLTVVDRRFIEAAHAQGLHVHVWTIDHPSEMRRLIELGVDGLMTDRPDRLASLLGLAPRPA
ncbi:MAG: glycerophosphodiester phosphodiesterase [Sorangiineae bacterium]|nr:glycerophosphodiester phosphodiesterase [Polyangiaceae bacterium]MEB2321407.1 glycerophosphodiester phosphodiesterase [Sorangiineae bacterium]